MPAIVKLNENEDQFTTPEKKLRAVEWALLKTVWSAQRKAIWSEKDKNQFYVLRKGMGQIISEFKNKELLEKYMTCEVALYKHGE